MLHFLKYTLLSLLILLSTTIFSQNKEINQYDANGKRHGQWKKHYENSSQIRYEGEFVHGKEIGIFKFYGPASEKQPQATKQFSQDNDSVTVTYFNQKGHITSEGKMIGKDREGKWKYYHKTHPTQLIMIEHYRNDQLDGWKQVFFPNGQLTEKTYYENGKRSGEKFVYGENGQLIQHYHFKNDQLHGKSEVYDGHGNLLSEGAYKNGLRTGKWIFYEDGNKESTKIY